MEQNVNIYPSDYKSNIFALEFNFQSRNSKILIATYSLGSIILFFTISITSEAGKENIKMMPLMIESERNFP
jgi:hypothetical protein